jgi:hypothetical protein
MLSNGSPTAPKPPAGNINQAIMAVFSDERVVSAVQHTIRV